MPFVTPDRPVLVTGASGFVGSYLLREMVQQGVEIDAMVALAMQPAIVSGFGSTEVVDITDREAVFRMIRAVNPSVVIHLAAIAEPARARQDQRRAWAVNVDGTCNLAHALLENAPDARLVFAGSAEGYGASFNRVEGAIGEDAPLQPMSAYGATKAAGDLVLSQLAYEGLDVIRFRAFNHTGPSQSAAYVVPAFAEQIAKIEAGLQPAVLSVGDLNAERDFLDVRDVVKAYVACLKIETLPPDNSVFNLSSGVSRTIQSILDELLALTSSRISVQVDPKRLRPSEVPHAAGDNSAARWALDWQPKIAFSQTLKDTLDALRAIHQA